MNQGTGRLTRLQNSVLAMVFGASLALYGCSDRNSVTTDGSVTLPDMMEVDAPNVTPDGAVEDGAVPTNDAMVPDIPGNTYDSGPCCTPAQCAALGQTCNTVTCRCEASAGCTQDGDPCDLMAAPVPGFSCVPDPDGTDGICRVTCDANGQCPPGSFCAPGDVCQPSECDGFFANNCAAGEKCFPADAMSYVCIDSGPAQEDESCSGQTDCGLELVCLSSRCTKADCTPLSTTKTCTEPNALCEGWLFSDGTPMDVGYCWIDCDPFVIPSGCPTGQWCFPTERDAATGEMDGTCVDDSVGTALEGAACKDSDDCANGLLCGADDTCQMMCDTVAVDPAPGACASGTCLPRRWIDNQSELVVEEWGLCMVPCAPWSASPTAAGCAPEEWCEPDFVDTTLGQCYDGTGTAAEGEVCGDAPEPSCLPGTFCGSGDGECLLYCAPEASAGAPGETCSSTQFCLATSYEEGGLPKVAAVGYCVGSCDHDAGSACTDPTETCVPSEILDSSQDICVADLPTLAPGADCTAAGVDSGFLCAPLSACFDISVIGGPAGVTCQPLCRASAGAVGPPATPTPNHPDCPASQPNCGGVFQGTTEFGLCLAPQP